MDILKKYKRKSIFKALIVPLLITVVVLLGFLKLLPAVECRLPNGPEYVARQQMSAQADNNYD